MDDDLLRKIGILCKRCKDYKIVIKRLKMELRLSKSHVRQTKCQIRTDYDWNCKEANFADLVLTFIKEWLLPRYKFLKDRWMEYDNGQDSLQLFLWGKVKISEGADYRDQWKRVICPTIQTKYVTIRCNLNKEVQKTFKSKCMQLRTQFFQFYKK